MDIEFSAYKVFHISLTKVIFLSYNSFEHSYKVGGGKC